MSYHGIFRVYDNLECQPPKWRLVEEEKTDFSFLPGEGLPESFSAEAEEDSIGDYPNW